MPETVAATPANAAREFARQEGNAPLHGPYTGGCKPTAQPAVCNTTPGACTTGLGNPGRCATTTGKAGYCHDDALSFACRADADCPAQTNAGPRAACVRCADCPETGGRARAVFDGSLG